MASRATTLSLTGGSKKRPPSDSLTSWFPSKQLKSADTGEQPPVRKKLATGRKLFLGHLRATCERYSSRVDLEDLSGKPVGRVDGLDILRLFLRDVVARPGDSVSLGKKFPLTECGCRHGEVGVPNGQQPCYTGGSKDAGKAQAFVMEDFRVTLLKWLRSKLVVEESSELISDVELDTTGYETDELEFAAPSSEEEASRATSFAPSDYPESDFLDPKRVRKRVTTKQRLIVVQYLLHHSDTCKGFRTAFKALCDPSANLLHLCGCGISNDKHPMCCVTGSHLKLAAQELNIEHSHVHFALELATSRDGYVQMLGAMKGSRGGAFDDLF